MIPKIDTRFESTKGKNSVDNIRFVLKKKLDINILYSNINPCRNKYIYGFTF